MIPAAPEPVSTISAVPAVPALGLEALNVNVLALPLGGAQHVGGGSAYLSEPLQTTTCMQRREVLCWPKTYKLAHVFLQEYSYKRLELAQLLGPP